MSSVDDGLAASPEEELGALIPSDPDWQPILHVSNQVVLYNPTSHALSVNRSTQLHPPIRHSCPYCKQALPTHFESLREEAESDVESFGTDPTYHTRAANYFHLLELSNETTSRPPSPPLCGHGEMHNRGNGRSAFPAEAMADGYFKAFFQEEYKLGMGANGSVFLCQHVLDGNPLGHFAVKKIAVGESHAYLLQILREVRLLEQMRHPNIITYHHAWLENCQFSAFGPKVPTLHVLMQWAEGGSLDDFIDVRLGRPTKHIHVNPLARFSTRDTRHLSSASTTPTSGNFPSIGNISEDGHLPDIHSRSARIRAFRAFQKASPDERERMRREMDETNGIKGPTWKAVHLLSADEVKSLFSDVVEGLAFLHKKSILHLDLKAGNVLLTWDEGKLIPRAMLSDFGTSRDMMNTSRIRSGNTGTLEYSSPETLPSLETGLLRQVDSKADMWSLGMILHKLLFFKLPYRYASEGDADGKPLSVQGEDEKLDRLEKEVQNYPGFKTKSTMAAKFEVRRLPRTYLILLESLLNIVPLSRPSVERVLTAMREGKFDPVKEGKIREARDTFALSPVFARRQSNAGDTKVPSPRLPGPVLASRGSYDSGVIRAPIVRRQASPQPDRKPDGESETFAVEMMKERTKLLGPPEGVTMPRDGNGGSNVRHGRWEAWTGRCKAMVKNMGRTGIAPNGWTRFVKSCLLAAKVFTISALCSEMNLARSDMAARLVMGINGTPVWRQRPGVYGILLGLALFDTVFDELWVSIALAFVHLVLLRLMCGFWYLS